MKFPGHQRTTLLTLMVMSAGLVACLSANGERVIETSEVDRTWAAHMTSPPVLVTSHGHQYLAHYNADRRLTLAWRKLGDDEWQLRHFPVVTTWATGGHAMIALTVDADGVIHLIPYRRNLSEAPAEPPHAIYYRSARPHDPAGMERVHMVSPEEPNPHYPLFLTAADGGLYFECRIGSSGKGSQVLYRHQRATGDWQRIGILLDGQDRMSAYGGPRLGPDGQWHCLWMWRDSPDAASNHTLSYMVSPDLLTWKNAAGETLEPPVNPDNPHVVIDPAQPGDGMINPLKFLGFDSRQRPVVTYHRYAPCGNSAIYNARFEEGEWKRVAAHVWDFRWDFGGGGAIGMKIRGGPVKSTANGRLVQRMWSERGGGVWVLVDEATLEPLGPASETDIKEISPDRAWQREHAKPEINFPQRPLLVSWLPDRGNPNEPGIRHVIRWEHGPVNIGDRPVPEPWPPAAPLRVFKIGK